MKKQGSMQPPEGNDSGPVYSGSGRRGGRRETSPERIAETRASQRAIANELRRMYDEVTKEPVPDVLKDLLKKIDRQHEN